jgi:hypothetical protein
MMKLFRVVAFILMSASASIAQGGPSYDETVQFIIQKSDNYSRAITVRGDNASSGGAIQYRFHEVRRCVFAVVGTGRGWYRAYGKRTVVDWDSEITIDFSTLDPSRAEFTDGNGDNYVRVRSSDDSKNIRSQNVGRGSNHYRNDFMDHFADIYVKDPAQRNGPKLEEAIKHLIRLCGGKEELF